MIYLKSYHLHVYRHKHSKTDRKLQYLEVLLWTSHLEVSYLSPWNGFLGFPLKHLMEKTPTDKTVLTDCICPFSYSTRNFSKPEGLLKTDRVTFPICCSFWIHSWKPKWEKFWKSMFPWICSICMTSTQIQLTYLAFESENK